MGNPKAKWHEPEPSFLFEIGGQYLLWLYPVNIYIRSLLIRLKSFNHYAVRFYEYRKFRPTIV